MARKERSIPGFKSSRVVAAENGVCTRTLMRRVKAGLFPMPIRDGGSWFWSVATLDRFYAARLKRAAA